MTRTVKEMEAKDIFTSLHLRRMDVSHTYPSPTKEEDYHRNMTEIISASWLFCLSDISEEDADCMIRTIEKFYQIMCERRKEYDKR